MRFNAASVTPRCRVRAYVVLSGAPHNFEPHRTETMMTGKPSPEGEVIATYGATMVAAFQVLINCLEENDAVLPGQFPDPLGLTWRW